ncbi:MAG: bifunctional diguanylate cyclase/phosphodiesterase [Sphaerochaetaceae bacterium]
MDWNIAPELISLGGILIILSNATLTKTHSLKREKFFLFALYYSIFAILLNLLSVLTISGASTFLQPLRLTVNSAYFFFYPPLSLIFIFYIVFYIEERVPKEKAHHVNSAIIALLASLVIYLVFPFINLKTGWLFSFSASGEYIRGAANTLPLYFAMFHILVGLSLVIAEHKYLDSYFFKAMLWLPIVALTIIIIQTVLLSVILTGTAMMFALLAIYLNFQTSKISIDSLTQLANRDTFVANIAHLLHSKQNATILVVSLDNFKIVNDTFGQNKGDLFLKRIASTLVEIVPKGQIYRYGGDEFAIVATKGSSPSFIDSVTSRFKEGWKVMGAASRLGASFAVLYLPFNNGLLVDPTSLLDYAIQKAKRQGSGHTIYCDALIVEDIKHKNQLADHLLQSHGESLSLSFQPVFSLETGEVYFVEALLRLESAEFGKVPPSEFIPLAEELGIIGELSRWAFERICQIIGANGETPTISLNFSGLQFSDPTIAPFILETLEHYNIPPHKLNIELTESTLVAAYLEEALVIVKQLITKGIKFHLDDFGTGYSNLSQMASFPFSSIKIDSSLLNLAKTEREKYQFIAGIVGIVKQMGFTTIVEGIENNDQLEFLKQIGCNYGQGYYLGKPLSEEEFTAQILTKKS